MSVNFYTGANQVIVKNTLTDELKTSYDDAVELVNKLGADATVEGSVAQRIAAIVANAPEKYDTLKEIATWIESDTDGAAKMQADISTLEADKLDKTSVSSWAKASSKPDYTASEINMADGTSVENAIGMINTNKSEIKVDMVSTTTDECGVCEFSTDKRVISAFLPEHIVTPYVDRDGQSWKFRVVSVETMQAAANSSIQLWFRYYE